MIESWKCPSCGYKLRNVIYPVRCKCGKVFEENAWDKEVDKFVSPLEGKGKPSKGLGDDIAKITSAVGIKPCGGCKRRQEKLNKLMPKEGTWLNTAKQQIKRAMRDGEDMQS